MNNWLTWLPTANAVFNGLSFLCLTLGYLAIRAGHRQRHKRFMLSALGFSCLFLISYLVYHAQVGSVHFTGQGAIRLVYFTILTTHTVLAMVIVPMVGITLKRALGGRFDRHRRIARWTLPLWAYVSVTGVVIYLMLYHL
ncbi:MAG: DUF420 domain-containing protein [Calditrichaeota bacterium]|nr:MAG: DUF420 domain-containing protein [Calditrichota bacterium]